MSNITTETTTTTITSTTSKVVGTTFWTTVATGSVRVYVYPGTTVAIPPAATTFTVDSLVFTEVNPTKLLYANSTFYAGHAITHTNTNDYYPASASFGDGVLILGPHTSTDTYPPHFLALATETDLGQPGAPAAPTPTPEPASLGSQAASDVPSSVDSATSITTSEAIALPPATTVELLSPSTSSTFSPSVTSSSTSLDQPLVSSIPDISFITIVPGPTPTPDLPTAFVSTVCTNSSGGFLTAASSGTAFPSSNITVFTGAAAPSMMGGNLSASLLMIWSLAIGLGIRKLWS